MHFTMSQYYLDRAVEQRSPELLLQAFIDVSAHVAACVQYRSDHHIAQAKESIKAFLQAIKLPACHDNPVLSLQIAATRKLVSYWLVHEQSFHAPNLATAGDECAVMLRELNETPATRMSVVVDGRVITSGMVAVLVPPDEPTTTEKPEANKGAPEPEPARDPEPEAPAPSPDDYKELGF